MNLMIPLQWYVNQQAQILPGVKTFEAFCETEIEEKIQVRDHLFSHLELIDQFIRENPNSLEKEELAIVSGWKNFIKGDFYIERFLKKHSIFISDSDDVYAVLGLTDAPSEFIDKRDLPIRIKTILLPFKGKIVYDGFLRFYNIYFGSGIRSELKQVYLIAKDNGAIIQTLDAPNDGDEKKKGKAVGKSAVSSKAAQDWTSVLADLAKTAKTLRGGGGQPATYSPAFSLVRTSIELAQLITETNPDASKVGKKVRRLDTLLSQLDNAAAREFY
ncbi:MAG: hypothetical protein AAFY72_02855 [Cyanobacteria bacterium J06649_4]